MRGKRIAKVTNEITRAAERRALEVDCPYCGQPAGFRCRTHPGGAKIYTYGPNWNEEHHTERRALADSHYTDDTVTNR